MKCNAIFFIGAAVFGLNGQTASVEMEAKVPFAFEVNGKGMPAGDYTLRTSATRSYATVKHAVTGRGFLFEVRPTAGVGIDRSALVFDRRGDRFVLNAVVDTRTGAAITIPQSRAARENQTSSVSRITLTAAE